MSIAVLGEALIDLIAGPDGNYRPHLGGSPYNFAIGLARQRVPVSYLSPFSEDSFGERLRNSLVKEGVRAAISRRSPLPTSLAVVTTDVNGAPGYRLYRDGVADKDIAFEEIAANLPKDLKLFHTGSLAITPDQLSLMRRLFELLRSKGVLVSLDINIRLRASGDTAAYLDGVWSLLKMADIVKASDEDLAAFDLHADTGGSAERAYAEMGSGMLALTEGSDGATLYTRWGKIAGKAYRVAKVEDTVGAGDTFHSAFLAYLYRRGAIGNSITDCDAELLSEAVNFAGAAAALNVSRAGCSPPTEEEVQVFIDSTHAGT